MEKILRLFKKIIPKPIYELLQPIYHFKLAFLAALFYGFPSRKMTVIGITGTKGKTTTCNLIAQILNHSGYKTGLATTVNFKIGEKEWPNKTKQTMLGRFGLQKLLYQMVKENCRYAVIETSSEGILQYRHRFIDYDAAVFLNLSPEHIERHGGFENYRSAKIKLFEKVAKKENGIGIYNLDDENVFYFLNPEIKNKFGYAINPEFKVKSSQLSKILEIKNVNLCSDKTEFTADGEKFEMPLIGEFNVYNAAAAICSALSQNIEIKKIKEALKMSKAPSGRFEMINKGQNFSVIIDYAHEPASLEAAYKAIKDSKLLAKNSKLICVLGATGGGRDKWKRPIMGKIAAKYCNKIILTNEDPYDEPPEDIINDITSGFSQILNSIRQPANKIQNLYEIIDREEAIKKAFSLAKRGDVVILTGKGGESWMCVAGGKKIPWDEKRIAEKILTEAQSKIVNKNIKYEIIDHPAELRLRVYGKTIEELFKNAAEAMADILVKSKKLKVKSEGKKLIKIKSMDVNSLLVDFLSEILAKSQINKQVYKVIKLKVNKEKSQLEGEIAGAPVEKFDEDIKAVTYENLDIKQINPPAGEWQTDLVFDI